MKKKGFTLIELLAIIVILAIIALIAVPVVLNIINKARISSYARSSENVLEAARLYYNEYKLDNTTDIEGNQYNRIKATLSGDTPDSGEVYIKEDGKMALALTYGNYCYKKDYDEKTFEKSEIIDGECTIKTEEYTPASCFTYVDNVEEGTISIVGYTCGGENGTHKDVVVPKTIDNKEVTIIGDDAFAYTQLSSVVIPNSVTSIELGAFFQNQLISVVIPNSVTSIGNGAFAYNHLSSVVIPNSVTSIGNGAFDNNQLSSIVIPNSVTSIGDGAFFSNQLSSVVIPNSVTYIGQEVFNYNQLSSVVIENKKGSVTLGDSAFGDFDVNNIEWKENN